MASDATGVPGRASVSRPSRAALALALLCAASATLAQPTPAGAVAAPPAAVAAPPAAVATPPATASRAAERVVIAGVVPDEATRQALLAKARELYGERVVDQLGVGNVVAPPNWSQLVQKLFTPDLKKVSRGQLRINGNVVDLSGDVDSDLQGQELAGRMTAQLNPTYTVRSSLRVPAAGQEILDASLANRTVEFQPGNALLTAGGVRTLDDLVPVLQRFKGRRFEVIGHTDAQGAAAQNMLLSVERANAVKTYLLGKGLSAASFVTSGAGSERPLVGNDTPEGRARNRRIEFRVLP